MSQASNDIKVIRRTLARVFPRGAPQSTTVAVVNRMLQQKEMRRERRGAIRGEKIACLRDEPTAGFFLLFFSEIGLGLSSSHVVRTEDRAPLRFISLRFLECECKITDNHDIERNAVPKRKTRVFGKVKIHR